MINKENLQHWKTFAESLAKEIKEFESQQDAQVDDWPMSVLYLPEIKMHYFRLHPTEESSKFYTEKDAKSALAFAQLSRLIRHVNKGWEPDFENREKKYTVRLNPDTGVMYADFQYLHDAPKCIFFKNKEDAERSIETWRQLWLDYFQADEQEG